MSSFITKKRVMGLASLIIAFLFLFPVYWAALSSFKLDGEIFANPPTLFPLSPTLKAYTDQAANLGRPFLNSCIIASISMALALVLALSAGYGLARYRMRGTALVILVFLVTQMLPSSLVLTPLYLIFSKLRLLNTYIAPALASATVSIPFIILLVRPIFADIPRDLEEAAYIDGCTAVSALIRVILPVAKSGIVTAACFGFVMAWNDLAFSMTFNSKSVMRPLTAGIYQFMSQYGTQWNKILAYGIIVIIPPLVLFLAMQKYIIKGLVSGAVKG